MSVIEIVTIWGMSKQGPVSTEFYSEEFKSKYSAVICRSILDYGEDTIVAWPGLPADHQRLKPPCHCYS